MISDIEQNLIEFFPEWQRSFSYSQPYKNLCLCFQEFLDSSLINLNEARSKLIHANMVFCEFCEKNPDSINEKLRINNINYSKNRNNELKNAFNLHKQQILNEF